MRILILLLCLCWTLPVLASEAILGKLKSGVFQGTIQATGHPQWHGKAGQVTVQKTVDGVWVTFKIAGAPGKAREEWLIQGADLVQRSYNADGRVVATAQATITADEPFGEQEATFVVECPAEKSGCTSQTLTLRVDGGALIYSVAGATASTSTNTLTLRATR